MPELTWEDVLAHLTTMMSNDLDVTVGQTMSYNEVTGIPHWILIVVGNSDQDVTEQTQDALVKLGVEVGL